MKNSGWIHISQLKKSESVVITEEQILFSKASKFSKQIAKLGKGRLLVIKKCKKMRNFDNVCKCSSKNHEKTMRSEYSGLPELSTTQRNPRSWGSWSKIYFLDHYSPMAVHSGSTGVLSPWNKDIVCVEQRQCLCGTETVSVWDGHNVCVGQTQCLSVGHTQSRWAGRAAGRGRFAGNSNPTLGLPSPPPIHTHTPKMAP